VLSCFTDFCLMLCCQFDSSKQMIYKKCVNTRDKIPSAQVMCVLSLMWQHVLISGGIFKVGGRKYIKGDVHSWKCVQN
jgi:hypothetical protein